MQIDHAIRRFETQLRADSRSARTVSSYLRGLRVLAGWPAATRRMADVRGPDEDDLSAFVTSPAVTTKAGRTAKALGSVDMVKMSLKAFFTFLVKTGVLPASPARLLRWSRRTAERATSPRSSPPTRKRPCCGPLSEPAARIHAGTTPCSMCSCTSGCASSLWWPSTSRGRSAPGEARPGPPAQGRRGDVENLVRRAPLLAGSLPLLPAPFLHLVDDGLRPEDAHGGSVPKLGGNWGDCRPRVG